MSEPSVVFVVDDDPSLRASLESLLSSDGHAVLSYDGGDAFLAADRPDLPGCLVLDVRLRGASGLAIQRDLTRAGVRTPVVFITGHGDVPMSVAAMKAGAIEFLMKPFRDQDLLDAIHRGIAADARRRSEERRMTELRDRFTAMTPREREILPLVASGLMNKQIAGVLGLSEVTVKVHRAQIMQKLHARTLADLVRMADRLAGDAPAPPEPRN